MELLGDKVAIVTGGAHGIGKAISEAFAAAGATVFIADIDATSGRQTAAAICRHHGKAVFVHCDVSSVKQVQRVVKQAAKSGRIDVLCNNAAYFGPRQKAGEAPPAEWEKSFRVSLLGARHFASAVLPFMVRQKSGSILNIS
jgi:NAD(P)-dependent dehydrogenase (short-subunit alcohol dehydrogenase family)